MTDAETLLETVREENRTALSRLGSSKSLYATTGGDIDAEPVLRATADAEYAAWRTFDGWADDEADATAREAFEAAAAEERDHYETVADLLEGEHDAEDAEPPAMQAALRDLEGTVERAGGFVGRTLAGERSTEQVVGFFVGDADPGTASTFRGFRDDLESQRARGLEAVCDSGADWERAEAAATDAIQAAYDEYVEALEGMGVNPKPVC